MDEFLGRLIEELQPYLNEDEIAYDVKVMVNNGVTENRIALRKDNAPTGPTIRVDGLVQAYNKGEVTMEMAARLVMNLFRHEESKNVHVPYVTEFTEDVAKRVRMMFVNQEKNKERLERGQVPFVRFEDCGLAGTFFVAGTTEDGEPKVRTEWAMHISYEMLKYWGCDLTAEDLFELSMKNLNAEDDTCIIATLDADVLNKKSGEVKSVPLPLEMYMVSLRSRNYGASAILADSVREQLREILQEDKVFVLPSSVHENIVVRYKPEYAEMLRRKQHEYKILKLQGGQDFNDEGYVFCDKTGQPFKPDRIYQYHRRFMKKLVEEYPEIDYVKLHSLRHSYASIAVNGGIQVKSLMSQLGHSEVKMTMELYAHAFEDAKKAEVAKINDTFKGVVEELKAQGM